MATATKSRGKSAEVVTPQAFLDLATDITTNEVVEREVEVRVMTLGLLANKNVHQLGPAGTGKSKLARAFTDRIIGARLFSKAVHAQMPADALLGGYDMPRFAQTGEFARNSTHYLPNAHVAFIDELTRANGPTLDSLLPILNTEERMAEANGGMVKTPLLFVVTASNYMPDPDDAHLGAFVDRITLMQYIDYVRSDDSFKAMLFKRHEGRTTDVEPVTITLEQLQAAQAAVKAIRPTHEFADALAKVRREAKNEGLMVSDRRWMESVDVASASAYLSDRDHLIPEDIVAIENMLWRERDQIPLAHKLILDYHGRFERDAVEHRQEMAAPMAAIDEIRAEVENTPPTEMVASEVMSKALSAARSLAKVKHRVTKLLEEAALEKRDAGSLRDIDNEIAATFEWLGKNDMPVPKG